MAYRVLEMSRHSDAETKWPPFIRRHFLIPFLELEPLSFDSNFTQVCLQRSYRQVIIGLDYSLARNRRLAVTWTNVNHDLWRQMAPLGRTELSTISEQAFGTLLYMHIIVSFRQWIQGTFLYYHVWQQNPTRVWFLQFLPNRSVKWSVLLNT